MEYIIRFAHPYFIYFLLPILLVVTLIKLYWRTKITYQYPLISVLKLQGIRQYNYPRNVLNALRFCLLTMLVFLIAKPRLVDPRSTITIEGIDIMIVLDVSGSMSLPHCDGDNRSRLEVAKKEAIRFIQNRPNDAIGLVVFGNDALSRCPLTIDKMVLKHAIDEIEIGSLVSAEGTLLARAILTAANRLKQSQATSKIMIVLTDGEPSPNDSDPQTAIMAAQQLGIKIYTVGIGDNQQIMVSHPIFGIATPFATTLNKELLTKIADQTGGKFFEAKNQNDMRHVYDTIDTLEKKKIEAPIFSNYVEWFMPLLWLCLALLSIEFLAKATLLQGVGI